MSCHEALLARKKQSRLSKQQQNQHRQSKRIPTSNSASSLHNNHNLYGDSPGSDSSKRSWSNGNSHRISSIKKDKDLPSIPKDEQPLPIPEEDSNNKRSRRSGIHVPSSGGDGKDHTRNFSFSSTPSVNSLQFENQLDSPSSTVNEESYRKELPASAATASMGEFLPIQLEERKKRDDGNGSSDIIIRLDNSSTSSHGEIASSLQNNLDDQRSLHTAKSSSSIKSAEEETPVVSHQLQPALEISDEDPSTVKKSQFQNNNSTRNRSPSPAIPIRKRTPTPVNTNINDNIDEIEKTQSDPNDLDVLIPERSDLRSASGTSVVKPATPIEKKGSRDLKRSPRSPSLKSARSIRSSKGSSSPKDSPTEDANGMENHKQQQREQEQHQQQQQLLSSPMLSLPVLQQSPGNTLSDDLTPFLTQNDSMENIYINTATPPRSPRAERNKRVAKLQNEEQDDKDNSNNNESFSSSVEESNKTLSPNSANNTNGYSKGASSPRQALAAATASIDRLDEGLNGALLSAASASNSNTNLSQSKNEEDEDEAKEEEDKEVEQDEEVEDEEDEEDADSNHPDISDTVISNSTLTKELVDSKKKIVELERLLNVKKDGKAETSESHVESLKKELREKRTTIAGLEAEGLVAKEELKVLNEAKEKEFSSVEQLMQEFEAKVELVKAKFTNEISDLINQRNDVKEEIEELGKTRAKAAEESTLLNIKNSQLVDMNNELTKQMIEKFGNHKKQQQLHQKTQNSSSSSSRRHHHNHDDESSKQVKDIGESSNATTSGSSGVYHVSTPSTSNATTSVEEQPMVTVLDKPQMVDTRKDRQHARKFWKRPGHAVAKGLNKVFANEEAGANGSNPNTPNIPPSDSYSSVTDLTQSSSGSAENGNGGLGITFPKDGNNTHTTNGSTTYNNNNYLNTNGTNNNNETRKTGRNGWFKSSSSNNHHATESNNASNGSLASGSNHDESSLMGVPIEKRIVTEGTKVPMIVTRCVEEIEKRGLELEGIYRKSGGKTQITAIEEAFEKCQEAKYDEVLSGDICAVTSVVKQYLRYLPTPLITYDVYEDFIHVCDKKDTNSQVEQMHKVVNKLPAAYKDCLEIIMRHLGVVTSYSESNRMTSKNLSVVFAPTLARHQSGEREIMDMQSRNDSTRLLIDHYDNIFRSGEA